jgi:PUA domain protein
LGKIKIKSGKMFKKFDEKENISGTTQLKSSVQKSIRAKIIETYPHIEDFMDGVLPKKDAFKIVKW